MREYKFRGKRIDNGEWAEGSLITNINHKTFIALNDSVYSINGKADVVNSYVHEVDHTTVGQYTELKDKNGVEVYGGDYALAYIVSEDNERYEKLLCTSMDGLQDLAWECEDGSGGYHLGFVHCPEECKMCSPLVEFEVIGNIHEVNNG